VYSVTIALSSAALTVGQSTAATATTLSPRGIALTGRVISWTSSNTAVATIAATGATATITAVSAGTVTITASSEGKSGSANLTVSDISVATVTVSLGSASIVVQQTTTATAILRDAQGNQLTGRAVTWSSSDVSVASVAGSGATATVTANAPGSAMVSASSEGHTGSAMISVTVSPQSLELTMSAAYARCRNVGASTSSVAAAMYPQLAVMSLESYSRRDEFGMRQRVAIPRTAILNDATTSQAEPGVFGSLQGNLRMLGAAIQSLDQLLSGGGSLGSPAQDFRARAFAFLGVGCNLGWLSLIYDSAAVIAPSTPVGSVPPLSDYGTVNRAALDMLDSAIAAANASASAGGANGFPAPATWFGGVALSKDWFVSVARSLKARLRAGVARFPEERAAVDWAAVNADVDNGIPADLVVTVGGTSGFAASFGANAMHADASWSQLPLFYWGFTDVSGNYDIWLNQQLDVRGILLLLSPDLRWPQGVSRAAQQAASPVRTSYTQRPYVKNRSTGDIFGDSWGSSQYGHYRYEYIQQAGGVGLFPEFLKVEFDLLGAEGLLRVNNVPAARARINITRIAQGLPLITSDNPSDPVPGGANCVPRVPVAPNFTSTACGNLLEALKYEKRMELAFNYLGSWYFDSRGWGDLVENTPVHFPVPFEEMSARGRPSYPLGGGGVGSARRGTYGFP
jgi:hypothetical protein